MIAIQDIAYVRVPTPDLDKMEDFLIDFGLHRALRTEDRLYMRGCGSQPFVHVSEKGVYPGAEGIGMWAQSLDDLHKLAAEAGATVDANDEPGGGHIVRLVDPAGMKVEVLYGQETIEPLPMRQVHDLNHSGRRARQNAGQRFEQKPSTILRLGHVVLRVPDFRASFDWYSKLLGMRISDRFYAGNDENTVMAFLHCGLGKTFTDHHTVALIGLPNVPSGIDHAAFEVLDLDDLMIGHDHLVAKGREHSWGVGRHVEGSQIFDYWRDPNGMKIEHWTDGDAVNEDYAGGVHPMGGPASTSPWGPAMTPEFFK